MKRYAITAAAVAVVTLAPGEVAADCVVDASKRSDCGYMGVTQSQCESKGCCWQPLSSSNPGPWCFYADSDPTGFKLTSMNPTPTGFAGTLQLRATPGSDDIATLSLEIIVEDNDYVHVRITDPKMTRWEVPQSVVSRPKVTTAASNPSYTVSYTNEPFTFTVTRKADNAVIFKSDEELIFKDQLLQIRTAINSQAATYGLGESTRAAQRLTAGTTITMWNVDVPSLLFDENLYGTHPMYLQLLPGGAAHGAFLMSSNGMDVSVLDDAISFKALGGMIDLYVFNGPSPQSVVQQYQRVVGKPAMVPYWSLGFHNCKYGYTSVYEIEDVVTSYAAAGIPLEVQWADIDLFDAYKDFTLDPINFNAPEMQSFIAKLNANEQHFVPIIDPGIMVQSGYNAYDVGVQKDVFVKDITGAPYLSQVWPGPTLAPDWFADSTKAWWTQQLSDFRSNLVNYDGIWIDMNEMSNFCNVDGKGQHCYNPGNCPNPSEQTTCCLVCSTPDPSNKLDFPPYAIGNTLGLLGTKTLPMSAMHVGNVSEYNVHNMFGITEAQATHEALVEITGKRPFILSRSSFAGQGQYSAHWTGDNQASWDDLRASIITINNFALFGMPMVGADVCGFIGDTTEELCARWAALGALTPFYRNHNALGNAPQEFYRWPSVAASARNAISMRYRLLPYLYTLMYGAYSQGNMVMRPLWANFASDAATWSKDAQFMLGDGVLVSPVLQQGATSVDAYFPQAGGRWYALTEDDALTLIDTQSGPRTVTLPTPITAINVHLRGGTIVPTQQPAMTTAEARTTPYRLLVPLCAQGKATGALFIDDGVQIDASSSYTYITYTATTSSVTSTIAHDTYSPSASMHMDSIVIAGLTQQPTAAQVNGVSVPASSMKYEAVNGKIVIDGLNLAMNEAFTITWS